MSEIQNRQSPFDALRHEDEEGEHWYARELMEPLEYVQWRYFNDAVNRARATMANAGEDTTGHFRSIQRAPGGFGGGSHNNPSDLGGRPLLDFRLSRRACYYVALAGDSTKRAIALAQQYFVTQTQFAERVQQRVETFPVMPNHAEALRGWADALDAQEKAEVEAAVAKAQVKALRPPAEAWQELVDTGQDYSVAEAANILNRDETISTGPGRLFRWLQDNGVVYRRGDGQLIPYAVHQDRFRLKPQSRPNHDVEDPRARKEANSQVRVTVSGLSWVQQRMREQNRPELVGMSTNTVVDLDRVREAVAGIRRG